MKQIFLLVTLHLFFAAAVILAHGFGDTDWLFATSPQIVMMNSHPVFDQRLHLPTEVPGAPVAGDRLSEDNRQTMLTALAVRAPRSREQIPDQVSLVPEELLKRHGQSRVSLQMSEQSIGYNYPFYESGASTWLFEVGSRFQGGRYAASGGLVYRRRPEGGPVLGLNGFINQDLSSVPIYRWGSAGVDLATPRLGLSANVYMPVGGRQLCHRSVTFDFFYDPDFFGLWARPAYGFDVSLEGVLPFSMPLSVAANSAYWFGDRIDVAGQGKETLALPSSRTFTVGWQPGPLWKLSASQIVVSRQKADIRVLIELFPAQWFLKREGSRGGLFLFTSSSQPSSSDLWQSVRNRFVNRRTDLIMEYQVGHNPAANEYRWKPFAANGTSKAEISTQKDLEKMCDPNGVYLEKLFNNKDFIHVNLGAGGSGCWVGHCYLAGSERFENKSIAFTSVPRGDNMWVHYSGKARLLHNQNVPSDQVSLKYKDGVWHASGKVAHYYVND